MVQNLDSGLDWTGLDWWTGGLDWTGLDAKMDCNIDERSMEWAWLATEVLLLVTGVHTQSSRELHFAAK